MELFEYIKSQLPQMPNTVIMKQLGASQELIDYVKETPWNTNLNVMGSIGEPKIATMDFVKIEDHMYADVSGMYNKTEYTGIVGIITDAETGDRWVDLNNLTPEIEEIRYLFEAIDLPYIEYYINTNAHVDLYHPFYPW